MREGDRSFEDAAGRLGSELLAPNAGNIKAELASPMAAMRSGLQLAKQLRERHPGCPMLFAAGTREELPAGLDDATFLLKPFGVQELYEAVSRAIG
jgi:FixJ family two-component response regulator